MKTILSIITLVLICTSCDPTPQRNMVHLSDGDVVEIVNIDSCQYIKSRTYSGDYVYSHKGDCTNSIHIYNLKSTINNETNTEYNIGTANYPFRNINLGHPQEKR